MKKLFPFLLIFCLSVFAAEDSGLSDARELADRGIIVNQSMAPSYGVNTTSDIQESAMYRLSDELIRQEALGIALKLKGVTLSDAYICRNYFTDTKEWWVCRSAEISADHDIVTRANLTFRPHDSLTLAEGLAVAMKALGIQISTASTTHIPGNLPIWQKRILVTIEEKGIAMDIRDNTGNTVAFYDPRGGLSLRMSYSLTRGQFFQVVMALLDYQESSDPVAHCATYSDGCNDCSANPGGSPTCTERMCFWQGVPKCYTCDAGYTLQNDRCVRVPISCVAEGGYAGGGFVPAPENPNDFQCCSGLTKTLHWSDETGDAGNTCARIGDGVCDSRYESARNSSDCRDEFDPSICKSYYDGCNSCSRTSNGQTICTLKACFVNGPAYCTEYISYEPANQIYDANFLSKVVSEMRNYAKDLSCTTNSQCQWSMVGYKACGGPSAAIAFSTKNIDQALITSKAQYITAAEKTYNERYDAVSDCMYVQPPQELSCVNGTCQ